MHLYLILPGVTLVHAGVNADTEHTLVTGVIWVVLMYILIPRNDQGEAFVFIREKTTIGGYS